MSTFLPPSSMLLLTSQSYESSRIGLLGFGAGGEGMKVCLLQWLVAIPE